MSSDPSDPLNQTGTGLPVFGRIKKLGETEEERAPAETFIPQEEYYDPADFEDTQGQTQTQPEYIQPPPAPRPPGAPQSHMPAPPQSPRPLMPAAGQPEEGKGLQLKSRTAAHLEYQERSDKTIAQFDEYFEQEMKTEPGFIETYFKMGETFLPKTRKIIAGVAAACLIFGIVISLDSFFLNLIFTLISFQAVLVLSLQKGTLSKLGLFPGRIILASVFSLLFIFVPLSYKWWQEQGKDYIQSFQNVEKLANQGQEAIKDAVKDAVKKTESTTGEYIDGEAIATHELNYATGLAGKFHEKTYLSGGGLLKMYLQYVFVLFGLTLLPFVKERNLLHVLYLRPENSKIQWKVARYFLVRLVKATIIALIFTVGLTFSGGGSVMFIAGTTFVLAGLSRFGPVAGLIMCIPVVVTQFKAGNGMTALIGLLVTGVIALIVESRIHWLMFILPMKNSGILPPALTKPKQQVIRVEGQSSGMIFRFMSLALTVAFYGAVAFAGWKVYGVWQEYSEVDKDIPRQVKKAIGDSKTAAINKLEKYRDDNPFHRDLLFSLTKAYARAGMLPKALQAAKDYRDFKSPEPDAEGLMEKGEQYIIKFLSKSNVKVNEKAPLLWLLSNFIELHADQVDSDDLLFIIKEMQETDPDEIKAFELAGFHYMAKANYDVVRKWCYKGLQKDKENVELLKLVVKSYLAEKDKVSALRALMEVDKVTTSDPETDELMKKARDLD